MSKYPAWALLPLLMIGIWGMSFSVCQGFMTESSPVQFLPDSCCDDVCRQMCQLVTVDSPVLSPKADSLVLELTSPSSLPVKLYGFEEVRPSERPHSFDLQVPRLRAPDKVYLLNAVFLI